ncbi:hypothetical protein [Clostridium fermenticellae]|uniref:hypothetical protein n=1 Tax=Clostridium fermenticellae TaxID=2068654 RepID=UPI0013C405F8|nr:hypothetical protein [Clostridium fermenticellae]
MSLRVYKICLDFYKYELRLTRNFLGDEFWKWQLEHNLSIELLKAFIIPDFGGISRRMD